MTVVAPPRQRKAEVGDTVVFCADADGLSQYWPHVGHTAEVIAIRVSVTAHRPSKSGRAVYTVVCSCAATLHPRSDAFENVR